MTPKEKAEQLFETFTVQEFNESKGWFTNNEETKLLAKYAVEEVEGTGTLIDRTCGYLTIEKNHKEYWQLVKAEIEKL
jgi:hypothetical protein